VKTARTSAIAAQGQNATLFDQMCRGQDRAGAVSGMDDARSNALARRAVVS
jgi:hypothetical protein